jgi:hypothetical protein
LLLSAAGCFATDRPVTTSLADSAGIAVVTNLVAGDEATQSHRLSTRPVFEAGAGVDPDPPLYRVTAVAPLGDMRVAVGTASPPQVLVLESDGTVAATAGHHGEGPGEFSYVGSVVALGADSLAVWDPYRRRISVFTTGGIFAREWT